MSKASSFKIIFLTSVVALTLSGCSISFNAGAGGKAANLTDGGVYRSLNKGVTWQQKASVLSVGPQRSLAAINIISLALDPEDNKAIYAGSLENGLFYSYDGSEGWQIAVNLGKATVANIAVDPTNKCVIYATVGNKVYKSADCNRTWAAVYFDAELNVKITSLVIDHSNNKNIFIGTSRGEIIKSADQGENWKTLNRFNNQVNKIVISPLDAKDMFVGTNSRGIFRSADAGLSWSSLADQLKDFNGGRSFRDLIIIRADKPTIFLATNYGLLKSTDNGQTWSNIELITPKAEVKINAILANPFNANEIYYVTSTTFYRSLDGGKSWSSDKLPSNRAGWKLLIDPKNPNILYLAANSAK